MDIATRKDILERGGFKRKYMKVKKAYMKAIKLAKKYANKADEKVEERD